MPHPDIALIGAGRWGYNLARNLSSLGRLAAVVDPDLRRLNAMADAWPHLTYHPDAAAVWTNPELRAVVIATPPASHAALAHAALRAGKDVLLEKPMASSVEEAQALRDLAARAGRVLMVGHVLAYHPAVARLRQGLETDAWGELRYLHASRLSFTRAPGEHDVLTCYAAHDVSVLMHLVGRAPIAVQASGVALRGAGPDLVQLHMDFGQDVRADVHASWVHPTKEQRLTAICERATVVFDDVGPQRLTAWTPALAPDDDAWRSPPSPLPLDVPPLEPLRLECEAFLQALDTRQPPITDGDEGLRVLRVLRACADSLEREGRRIDLDLDWSRTPHD